MMDPRLARVIDTKLLTYTVEQAAEPAGGVHAGWRISWCGTG